MNASVRVASKPGFLEELKEQRWDDHRFYHQSRVNQSLHLFSATCFLTSYILVFFNPIAAALLGWVIAMWSRQIGHFFFEPKGFDRINKVTFEHKESVKVGYNLQRKVILFIAWISLPVLLWFSPTFFGLFDAANARSYTYRLAILWWGLAFVGFLLRTFWLCATRNFQTGAVWFTKILTDPFHDVMMYHKAPIWLLKGQWLDPMEHAE